MGSNIFITIGSNSACESHSTMWKIPPRVNNAEFNLKFSAKLQRAKQYQFSNLCISLLVIISKHNSVALHLTLRAVGVRGNILMY